MIERNLHSNLVIFKCKLQMKREFLKELFTFQSGDIQIFIEIDDIEQIKHIYIPIW